MKYTVTFKLIFTVMLAILLQFAGAGYCVDQDSSTKVDGQDFSRLRTLADQRDSDAQSRLADLYLWGWGTELDEAKAWGLLQQAAQNGNARAMHRIGSMYEQGIYVAQDYRKALQWHLRSANQGYAPAQSDVGIFYEDGFAGARDIDAALFWYEKAAQQGEPFAVEALQRLDKQTK